MIKRGKKGLILATIAILIFGGISLINVTRFIIFKGKTVDKDEKIPVEVVKSKVKDLQWILEETGDIRPMIEVDVYPKVSGKIIEILLVEKGDYLKKGDLTAELEDDTIKARIAEAKAGLEAARANLKQIEANRGVIEKDRLRLINLYQEKVISRQRLDHIEAEYTAVCEGKRLAESQVNKAEAVLKQLEIENRNHRIYAPITGYVSARYLDPGAMSDIRYPIIRISREEQVKVITTVTAKDFPHIKKGQKVEIEVDAFPDRIFHGVISIINPTIDPATRTGEIEIYISNQDLTLSSGMFAHVRLFLGERKGITIELDALNRMSGTGNYYIYVIEGGRAKQRNVKTGISQENIIEIIDGLSEGELVVVKGHNRLKDGYAVRIVSD